MGTSITLPTVAAADYSFLAVGEESVPRQHVLSATAMTSGLLRLAYRKANKSELVTQMRMITNTTPAGATPTLVRMGIWTMAANGDLTLVASTPNDTTLLAAATTTYTKSLSVAYQKVKGQWYAFGALVVTGATAPTAYACIALTALEMGVAPKLGATLAGQTDLPSSVPSASAAPSSATLYMVASP